MTDFLHVPLKHKKQSREVELDRGEDKSVLKRILTLLSTYRERCPDKTTAFEQGKCSNGPIRNRNRIFHSHDVAGGGGVITLNTHFQLITTTAIVSGTT